MFHNRWGVRFGKTSLRLLGAIALVVGIGVGGVVWWRQSAPNPIPNGGKGENGLSIEELARAVTQARIAIGHLENEKFAEADQIFAELLAKLPHEPLVARDLAIGRVLTLESTKGDIAVESVQQALDALAKVEPESPVTNWLVARANLKLAEKNIGTESGRTYHAAALQQLREATRRDPSNAAFWYQTYEGCKLSDDDAVQEEGFQALDHAYRAAPTNLRLALEWLYDRASAKDPKLAKSIAGIRALIEPIAPGVKRRTNYNVLEYFDQLQDAVEKQQWDSAKGAATKIRNILNSEELTRSDLRRIQKNPLEFVIHDFSPTVRQALATSLAAAPPGIEVKFVPAWGAQEQPSAVLDAKLVDFDLDGQSELVVLEAAMIKVLRLEPDGRIGAVLVTAAVPPGMRQLLIADLDRDTVVTAGTAKAAEKLPDHKFPFYDADPDVVTYGTGGVRVLKNQLADDGQTRTLEVVPQDAPFEAIRNILTGGLVDIDHDGDLDAILSVDGRVQVWWNRDNLTFEDVTVWSQLPPPEMRVETLSMVDWDRDVDTDVVVGGAGMKQSGVLENLRHGQVRWRAFDEDFSELGNAVNLTACEIDGNASWDFVAVGPSGVKVLLTTTIPAKSVAKLRATTVAASSFQHATVFDYDNDGSTDLLATGDGDPVLLRGQPEGSLSAAVGVLPASARFAVSDAVDADGDGDLDLLTLADGKLSLLRNDGGNKNHWLSVRVRGEAEDKSGRVNHFGLGSVLELMSGMRYQAQTAQRQTEHFGLGDTAQADVLRVLFTNGIPQSIVQPTADQIVSEKMVNKGSCPFVYGWNGQRFEFVTDLCWNAPLGLQLADGVIAKDRPWEYLKIRGDQLIAQDGYYELRITEELWEAGYFDQVELIAVDHPDNVEVYTNEKVGPAEISERFVHTVRNRRQLVAARNHRGRDLLPALAHADGEMAVPFDRTLRKGRAEDHYLEIDLGQLADPRRITLFLTGWIQPGDTSLSVAASHNPELSPGQPPSIWTPDASGEWKQTVPFMGFPGGKPKTIAVDLSRAFQSHDYRLRIATNFELYWDEAFFTVDEEPGEIRQTTLPLVSADLHFRGFSAVTPFDGSRPETFDYNRCDKSPSWPPMQGRFTRYGPVKELLTGTDRRLVVLAAGDELTVRFAAPPAPAAGWARDFLMYNVGWDKDADLNTVVGQTVEPLPFVGMSGYPYVLGPADGDDADQANAEFARYLLEYQTRETTPSRFWRHWFEPR